MYFVSHRLLPGNNARGITLYFTKICIITRMVLDVWPPQEPVSLIIQLFCGMALRCEMHLHL